MKISAAIIVKNEELIIRRCVECVSKFADEIIIVDTGSSDKTKEIARELPKVRLFDSVYFGQDTHYSDFSFSVAKNEAVDRCTGDWVVWWDADDFIKDEGAAVIRRLAEANEKKLYTFVIKFGMLTFEHARMFRKDSGIRFDEGHACHEYLLSSGIPQEKRHDVIVEHLPGKKSVPSNTRNLAILEKDYYERKRDDQRTIFYLANSYKECGRYDDAVEFYDKYLKISGWKEERFFASYYKAQVLSTQGKIEQARNACLNCIQEDYRFAEPYCFLGDLCLHERDFQRAIKWYEMALSTPFPKDTRLFVNQTCYDSYPKAKIDECRKLMGAPAALSTAISGEVKAKGLAEPVPIPEGMRVYSLPDDRCDAILALFALAMCKTEGVSVGVSPDNEWKRDLARLYNVVDIVQSDKPMTLEYPDNLKSRHLVSWYCRSAGFIFGKFGVVKFDDDFKKDNQVVIGATSSWNGWQAVVDGLQAAGISTKIVWDEEATVDEAMAAISSSEFFVGARGWLQHLAASAQIDSVVFWDKEGPELEGWPDQNNIMAADGGGMRDLEPEMVVSIVKNRCRNGDRGTLRPVEAASV